MAFSRFSNVSVEPDTTILFQQECFIDDLSVLYQKWSWGGVVADTIIFTLEDVPDLTDDALVELVRETALPEDGTEFTVRRSGGYAFINLNFGKR